MLIPNLQYSLVFLITRKYKLKIQVGQVLFLALVIPFILLISLRERFSSRSNPSELTGDHPENTHFQMSSLRNDSPSLEWSHNSYILKIISPVILTGVEDDCFKRWITYLLYSLEEILLGQLLLKLCHYSTQSCQ